MNFEMTVCPRLTILLPCLALAAGAPAQDAPVQPPGITFRTSVQEVSLDLIVRDNRGRQVKNLKPEEVEVLEDGVRQQIKSFRLVSGRESVPAQAEESKKEKAAPKSVGSPARPLPAVNYICIVFHNLDGYTLKYAIDATEKFLDRELQPGTGVALFSLGTRLSVLHKFTSDRKELMRVAANSMSAPAPGFMRVADAALNATPYQVTVTVSPTGDAVMSIGGGTVNQAAITGADVGTSQGENVFRGLFADQRRAFGQIVGMQAWDQMNTMLDELGPLPGRKTVLLLSTGLATTGETELFQRLLDRANKAQISVYAVDVNGMAQNSNVMAGNTQLSHVAGLSRTQGQVSGTAGTAAEKSRQGDYLNMAVRTSDPQAALRALSEGTGGFLIANTEDLRKPFQRLLEDVDTHYEAVYRPTAEKYDGHLRKIEVKLTRPNLNVQCRTGYYALPALPGSHDLTLWDVVGLAALDAPERPHAFDFRSAVFQFRPAGSGLQDSLALELPAAAVTATPVASQRRRVHVALFALVKDASGQIVDQFSQDTPYEIPEENMEKMRGGTIPFTHPFDLPPGHYTVEAAVWDREANRVSAGTLEFDNTEMKGLSLSSVAMVQEVEPMPGPMDAADPFEFKIAGKQAMRVIPELSTSLSANAHPVVYFVVYPDKSNAEKARLQVELLAGGQVIDTKNADVATPGALASIPMVVKIPANPGNCAVRITVFQGSASATRTLRYTMAAR